MELMDSIEWQKMFEAAVNAYEKVAFRPELSLEEREQGAREFSRIEEVFTQGGCVEFLTMQLKDVDDRRRNTAARLLSVLDDSEATRGLWSAFLSRSHLRISAYHVLRSARVRPLPVELAAYLPALDTPTQSVLIRALLAHPSADARALLWSLVEDAGYDVGEVAVDAVARWDDIGVLNQILKNVDEEDNKRLMNLPGGVRAALHLGLWGSQDALAWMIEQSRSNDPREAAMACASLGLLGRPEALWEVDGLFERAGVDELYTALQTVDNLGSTAHLDGMSDVVQRYALNRDDFAQGNPADHAIRIMERITGRTLPDGLASYDLQGNPDTATRLRSSMLFRSISGNFDADMRYLEGELLTLENQLEDLVSLHRPRMTRAYFNLRAATGCEFGFDLDEDLVGNQDAVHAWREAIRDRGLRISGDWWWQGESIDMDGTPKVSKAS
jgi:hypothetical protein